MYAVSAMQKFLKEQHFSDACLAAGAAVGGVGAGVGANGAAYSPLAAGVRAGARADGRQRPLLSAASEMRRNLRVKVHDENFGIPEPLHFKQLLALKDWRAPLKKRLHRRQLDGGRKLAELEARSAVLRRHADEEAQRQDALSWR